jgi:hypothetical protein
MPSAICWHYQELTLFSTLVGEGLKALNGDISGKVFRHCGFAAITLFSYSEQIICKDSRRCKDMVLQFLKHTGIFPT